MSNNNFWGPLTKERMKALISFRRSVVPHITKDQARQLGNELNVDWHKVDIRELMLGIAVELEHKGTLIKLGVDEKGLLKAATSIALDHLVESKRYYSDLKKMEGK